MPLFAVQLLPATEIPPFLKKSECRMLRYSTLRRFHPVIDKDFQIKPPFIGIKIAVVLITGAAV
nr:MAG TPA: hypothetical protein [Caudoviricetes sp.]